MRHILVTWNPGPDNDEQYTPEQWKDEVADPLSPGGLVIEGSWDVGGRTQGIDPGDRVYLLRQGTHGRGIVALGEFTSPPEPRPHWRNDGTFGQFTDIDWSDAVEIDNRLDIDVLKAEIPEFDWNSVRRGGRDVTPYGDRIEALWADAPVSDEPVEVQIEVVTRGGGFGSAEENRRVEQAAIEFVTADFEGRGYAVKSREIEKVGWDLDAQKGAETLRLEVKGVRGVLPHVFLTANEHDKAQTEPGWRLVIVTDALGTPTVHEVDGATATSSARPVLHRVQLPAE